MKRLFIYSILFAMIIYNKCSDCTEGKETQTNQNQQPPADDTQDGDNRRRLALNEETCSKLKTSDDTKYKCSYNKDTQKCEETSKASNSSSIIKISLFLLISLLFI